MADIDRLPDTARIEQEASEWIARLNADDVSAEDRSRFDSWRRAHFLHGRVYDELSATWRAYTSAGPLVRAVSFGQLMNEAAEARRPQRRRVWPAAAMVAAVAAAIAWYTAPAPREVFATAIGEQASVSLPDGSTMQLNSNSLALIDYSRGARIVRLERGEGFFRVIHNTAHPFWVVSGSSWVRAVGTAFDVNHAEDRLSVIVSEGSIEVGKQGVSRDRAPTDKALTQLPILFAVAGQEVEVDGSATIVRTLSAADIARTEAWRSGVVYFENQPLKDVVAELSRYTSLKLSVDDAKLQQTPVGGTFRANSGGVETFLRMLKDGLRLKIRREAGHVYIERANESETTPRGRNRRKSPARSSGSA